MWNASSRTLQLALVVSAVLLIGLILFLVGSIQSVPFEPGRDFTLSAAPEAGGQPPVAPGWAAFALAVRILFVAALTILTIQLLVSRQARRTYLILALIAGGLLLLTHFVGCNRPMTEPQETIESQQDIQPLPVQSQPTQDEDQQPERGMGLYIILAITLSGAIVGIGGFILFRSLLSRPVSDAAQEEILDSISDAANRLRAGEDPRTVVLFCYQEMVRILSTRAKINATFLTPREFEGQLRRVGLSGEHTAQLTGIFEVVRYAGRVDDGFSARALACLEAIEEAYDIDPS
jgi:hypothetical protein